MGEKMKSIRQSRQINREFTRMKINAECDGCQTGCQSIFLLVPTGATTYSIPKSEWNDCGVPTPTIVNGALLESITMTHDYDTLPNPSELIIDFGAPTTFDIYIQLTF